MPFDPSSREAEAQAEIAATRISRGIARAITATFLALLAAGPALELIQAARGGSAIFIPLPAAEESSTALDRLDALFREVENRFDERSALVRLLRPPTQWLLTTGARYGNEEAIAGLDGWLFFGDDFAHLIGRKKTREGTGDPAAAILDFQAQLAERGVALLVVPVPVKPTVHPERLAHGAGPAPVRRAGEIGLLAQLAAAGVPVLDLADRFARDARLGPLYLATDTHWRPEAVEVAAREIAIRLRELITLPAGARREAEPRTTLSALGDTYRLLGLPSGARLGRAERVELRPSPARPPLSGLLHSPVLLLGDSFAAIYSLPELGWGAEAGLPERLAFQLGLPVDRIVRNAGGALATRQAFAAALERDPVRFAALRVVVWEFAAREWSQGDWRPVALPSLQPAP